jgi:hypothetical protein
MLEGSAQQQENQLRYPTQQRGDNEVPKKYAKVAYERHAEDVSSVTQVRVEYSFTKKGRDGYCSLLSL